MNYVVLSGIRKKVERVYDSQKYQVLDNISVSMKNRFGVGAQGELLSSPVNFTFPDVDTLKYYSAQSTGTWIDQLTGFNRTVSIRDGFQMIHGFYFYPDQDQNQSIRISHHSFRMIHGLVSEDPLPVMELTFRISPESSQHETAGLPNVGQEYRIGQFLAHVVPKN